MIPASINFFLSFFIFHFEIFREEMFFFFLGTCRDSGEWRPVSCCLDFRYIHARTPDWIRPRDGWHACADTGGSSGQWRHLIASSLTLKWRFDNRTVSVVLHLANRHLLVSDKPILLFALSLWTTFDIRQLAVVHSSRSVINWTAGGEFFCRFSLKINWIVVSIRDWHQQDVKIVTVVAFALTDRKKQLFFLNNGQREVYDRANEMR